MSKFIIFLLLLVINQSNHASLLTFPSIPQNCFEEQEFCTQIILRDNGAVIDLYAALSYDDFETHQDLVDLYFNFDIWGDYVNVSDDLYYKVSKRLDDTIDERGEKVVRHYVHYYGVAPWPINKLKVREVAKYYVIKKKAENILSAYRFTNLHEDGESYAPSEIGMLEDPLLAPEGLREKSGLFMVRDDSQNNQYIFYMSSYMVSEMDLLPKVAATYAEKNVATLVKLLLGL